MIHLSFPTFKRRPWLSRQIAIGLVLGAAALLGLVAPSAQAAVDRGVQDESFVWTYRDGVATCTTPADRERILTELARDLHVQTVRLNLLWDMAEPAEGVYSDSYIEYYRQAAADAKAHGLKVMLAVYETPEWASDTSLWSNRAFSTDGTGYHTYYPPALNKLAAWQRTATYLATTFKGLVSYWECWNEPNLWGYFYPQCTATDSSFASRRYTYMLRSFYIGIKAGDPAAKVLGGVTAPPGNNNRLNTSPQKFAADMKRFGAAAYMDGYDHHAYAGGVGRVLPPEAVPQYRNKVVSLGNISALLKIFPTKPFYISEYGYTTRPVAAFGGARVSQTTQADYLTRAFRLAARYPQIKMLVWFQRQDWSPSGSQNDTKGNYFGLRDLAGRKKPSWYAYARLATRKSK